MTRLPKSEQGPLFVPSRRDFLKSTAVATIAAAPYYVPASVFGSNAPSNRISVGCIGVGNQGFPVMQRFLHQPNCQVLAVCDVNRGSEGYKDPGQVRGREPAQQEVERHYGSSAPSGKYQGCEAYIDFRKVLARDDIDAVVIAAPDHWHAIMTTMACEAGKDIYCEKPLGLTIGQQQAMIHAVRKHNRILQTGSHERSNPIVRRACELVRDGHIGEVKRVVAHVGRHNKVGPGPGWQPMPVPDGLDYEMWLGPAPEAPYHEARCLYNFRFNYDYAGGQVTNFGAHSFDMAQWGLGMDKTGPVSVECKYAEFLPEGSLFNAATYTDIDFRYANGTVLECRTAEPSVRCIFEGTEGLVRVDNMGKDFVTVPVSLKKELPGMDEPSYYSGDDHVRNFIDCVKSRSEPVAPVEVGHRSGSVCHLGNIACRMNAKLKWDPQAEKFVGSNSEKANEYLHRDARSPWSV
jgi:predicted dehydrogenase